MDISDSSSDKESDTDMCNILGNISIEDHSIASKKNDWYEDNEYRIDNNCQSEQVHV